MDGKVRAWRNEGKHLPPILRDFHDQKDLFKAMDGYLKIPDDHPAKDVGLVTAQCYTIDVFLWFMAQHGYTLQKSRASLPFDNLGELIKVMNQKRQDSFASILMPKTQESTPPTED